MKLGLKTFWFVPSTNPTTDVGFAVLGAPVILSLYATLELKL
jgi:hypothetical protein